MTLAFAFSMTLWTSVWQARARDTRFVLRYVVGFWLFLTPVAYPSSLVPEQWRWVYGLNPMAGVVEGFRWALLGTGNGPDITLWVSAIISILIFISGLFYFRSMEKTFADVV